MLKRIKLTNFKCFQTLDLDLKPLNVLMGLNGMGKSTLIQSLLLLRQSYQETDLNQLKLNGSLVSLGNGSDILFERADRDCIEFELYEDSGSLSLKYDYNSSSDRLNGISEIIGEFGLFSNHMSFLSAYRIKPQDLYHIADEKRLAERDFGEDGEFALHYLNLHGGAPVENDRVVMSSAEDYTLFEQTKAWLALIAPGIIPQIQINQSLRNLELKYVFREGEDKTNAYRSTNVGFGITYVLPVIVTLLSAKPGELLLVENPEAHIHPAGQSQLGRLISLAASGGVQIIVETHSDHIVNGIRLAVKEGRISSEAASILYFGKDPDNHYLRSVRNLNIDSRGKINEWPEGFLDEWDNALIKLL